MGEKSAGSPNPACLPELRRLESKQRRLSRPIPPQVQSEVPLRKCVFELEAFLEFPYCKDRRQKDHVELR